jgi:hypothetical protein
MIQNIKSGNRNTHEDFVEKIIKDHKKKTAHLNYKRYNINPLFRKKVSDVHLNKGEMGLIIKDNIQRLKAQNKDQL